MTREIYHQWQTHHTHTQSPITIDYTTLCQWCLVSHCRLADTLNVEEGHTFGIMVQPDQYGMEHTDVEGLGCLTGSQTAYWL